MPLTQTDSLLGKCALITGAARRIGASIAKTLHTAGADVVIHYRGAQSDAERLCSMLNDLRSDSAITYQASLDDPDVSAAMLEHALRWRSRLDILVNNASSFYPTPVGEIAAADWHDLMGSNLKGPLFLSQAAATALREAKGSIVNIVDIHAQKPLRHHIVYGSAKAGLVMLTKALARELAPDVRVNGVAPGAIAWPESGMSELVKESILRQIPLGRSGKAQDIANCVLFLVRDATYTSGQIVAIDGGRSLGW